MNGPAFEESLAELESILRALEDGATGLDDALNRYERGVGLLRECYGQLRHAEQRILAVSGTDEEGRPLTQPFAHASSVAAVPPPAAVAKRPTPRKRPPDENLNDLPF